MRIVELILNEEEEQAGIDAVPVVNSPAIESDFVALKKHQVELKTINDEKRLLMGAALIPDKQIFRKNGDDEYYIYFSKDTIRKASQLFLKKSNQNNATIEHERKIEGMSVVESWVKEGDQDKSSLYNFDHPVGTWYITMKVENDEVWKEVKSGNIKGFSIEGYFAEKVEASKQELKSYSDYPDAVKNNAKRGVELNKKNNNKCATLVGKQRGSDLSAGRPLTVETIKRMYSYLSRAKTYYDNADTNDCGNISYLLWGGLAGLRWSESKLKELGKLEATKEEINKETLQKIKNLFKNEK